MVCCHTSCLDSLKLYAALWNASANFRLQTNRGYGKIGNGVTLIRSNPHKEATKTRKRAVSRGAKTVSVPPPSDPSGLANSAVDGNTLARQLALRPDTLTILILTSALGGSWFVWKKFLKKAAKNTKDGGGVIPLERQDINQIFVETAPPADSREYRMALARTRQAVSVHRAIGFLYTGNTARAMVELRRALHENSVCRAPLLNTHHEAEQLQQLYRLHLHNTAQPADFATLLQLRTMLDLDFDIAERIEKEVLEEGSAYSI